MLKRCCKTSLSDQTFSKATKLSPQTLLTPCSEDTAKPAFSTGIQRAAYFKMTLRKNRPYKTQGSCMCFSVRGVLAPPSAKNKTFNTCGNPSAAYWYRHARKIRLCQNAVETNSTIKTAALMPLGSQSNATYLQQHTECNCNIYISP